MLCSSCSSSRCPYLLYVQYVCFVNAIHPEAQTHTQHVVCDSPQIMFCEVAVAKPLLYFCHVVFLHTCCSL